MVFLGSGAFSFNRYEHCAMSRHCQCDLKTQPIDVGAPLGVSWLMPSA